MLLVDFYLWNCFLLNVPKLQVNVASNVNGKRPSKFRSKSRKTVASSPQKRSPSSKVKCLRDGPPPANSLVTKSALRQRSSSKAPLPSQYSKFIDKRSKSRDNVSVGQERSICINGSKKSATKSCRCRERPPRFCRNDQEIQVKMNEREAQLLVDGQVVKFPKFFDKRSTSRQCLEFE